MAQALTLEVDSIVLRSEYMRARTALPDLLIIVQGTTQTGDPKAYNV